MSHYTVLVRVSRERLNAHGSIDDALRAMMEPYDENAKDEKYLTFNDNEDEERAKYDHETIEMFREVATGKCHYTWDERFRVPGTFGLGSHTHVEEPPAGYERADVPFNVLFDSFERYMAEFTSQEARDPKKGRYGYWRNEKGYWDWYKIGGRWRGFFPLRDGVTPIVGEAGTFDNEAKEGHGDIVKIGDLDLPALRLTQSKNAQKYWKDWLKWQENPVDDSWTTGIRSRALDCGFMRVVQGPHEPASNEIVFPWAKFFADKPDRQDDPRRLWNDVVIKMTEKEFLADYEACFHPLLTYAALDDNGWHQPGEMGWFGVSHAEDGAKAKFQRDFVRVFIDEAKPTDLLVLLDCHT